MSEWKEVKLGTLCTKVCSGGTPKSGVSDYYGGGIPWLNTKEVNFNRIYSTENTISQNGLDNSSAKWIDANSIIVAMYGATAGKVAITKIPITTNQACCNLTINNELADYNYIYYTLKKDFTILASLANGGAQQNLNTQIIKDYSIRIPDLPTQQRIASILSSLDAKIENNNKINAKLEEIAQNLFKEWFVDFGPFKDGKFVESELGLIPEGWRVGTLEEVCTKITDGSHFSPQNSDKDNIPMLSVKDMEEYGFKYKTCKHISKEDYLKLKESDCVPQVNDILVAKDGSYLKEIFICDEFKEQAILSSIAIFRPNNEIVTPDYLLSILKSPKVMKDVKENYVSGSAVPRIVLKDFKKLPILIPTYKVQSEFTNIYKSCRDKIYGNCNESQRLSTLRDTLLPKLMSGEIEV